MCAIASSDHSENICFLSQDSTFPPDMGINPLLAQHKGPSPHLTRAGGFRLTNTITAHDLAVSA